MTDINKELDYKELLNLCKIEGFDINMVEAVITKESEVTGAFTDDHPTILFEFHKFRQHTNGRFDKSHPHLAAPYGVNKYGKYSQQWKRFKEAYNLEDSSEAAIMSCSWGLMQVLGENYRMCGWENPHKFMLDMYDISLQVYAGLMYIKNKPSALKAFRNKDFKSFAEAYNGKDYEKNKYDTKLKALYEDISQTDLFKVKTPTYKVRDTQKQINEVFGENTVIVDGLYGKNTDKWYLKLKSENKLTTSLERLGKIVTRDSLRLDRDMKIKEAVDEFEEGLEKLIREENK